MSLKDKTVDELILLAFFANEQYWSEELPAYGEFDPSKVTNDDIDHSELFEFCYNSKAKEGITYDGILVKGEECFGGEGKGDTTWFVFSFTEDGLTRYVKRYAHYDSWEGGYWQDGTNVEVVPREVTVTKWVAK